MCPCPRRPDTFSPLEQGRIDVSEKPQFALTLGRRPLPAVPSERGVVHSRLCLEPGDLHALLQRRRDERILPALHASLAHRQASRHDGTFGTHTRGQERLGSLPHPLLERCERGDLGRKRRRQLRQLIGDQRLPSRDGLASSRTGNIRRVSAAANRTEAPNARDASSTHETRTCRKATSRKSRSGYARRSMQRIAIDRYSTECGLLSKIRSQGRTTTLA